MYRAIKLVCSFMFLILISTSFSTTSKASPLNVTPTYNFKISFNETVLFNEKVAEGKTIQVLDDNKEITETIVLKNDLEITLESPEIPEGHIFSYWDIQQDDAAVNISPMFAINKKLQSTFISTGGGRLLNENTKLKEITKTYTKDTLLKEIAPDVSPGEGYKFKGWREGENTEVLDVTDTTKPNNLTTYFALFYKDINDNNLDDTTESATLKFVPNNGQKLEDQKLYVGQSFSLPKLSIKKDHIFLGWYVDKNFKTALDIEAVLLGDTTLYAKWETFENIVKQSENNPITNENVSIQIENILTTLRQQKQTAQPAKTDNETTKATNQSNEVLTYTETKYVFNNKNVGELYMVKFFDLDDTFLFSITVPYGRSIHLLDQSDNLKKEYSVRQDTSLIIDSSDYAFNNDDVRNFDSQTTKVNNVHITEIYPVLQHVEPQAVAPITKTVTTKKEASKLGGFISLGILLVIIIAGVIYYFVRRNKKTNIEIIN